MTRISTACAILGLFVKNALKTCAKIRFLCFTSVELCGIIYNYIKKRNREEHYFYE